MTILSLPQKKSGDLYCQENQTRLTREGRGRGGGALISLSTVGTGTRECNLQKCLSLGAHGPARPGCLLCVYSFGSAWTRPPTLIPLRGIMSREAVSRDIYLSDGFLPLPYVQGIFMSFYDGSYETSTSDRRAGW